MRDVPMKNLTVIHILRSMVTRVPLEEKTMQTTKPFSEERSSVATSLLIDQEDNHQQAKTITQTQVGIKV
jgi:hypothetical protein